jgi:hypothetical protein
VAGSSWAVSLSENCFAVYGLGCSSADYHRRIVAKYATICGVINHSVELFAITTNCTRILQIGAFSAIKKIRLGRNR